MKTRSWFLLALSATALVLIGHRDDVATSVGLLQRKLAATVSTDPHNTNAPQSSVTTVDAPKLPAAIAGATTQLAIHADAPVPPTTALANPAQALQLSAAGARAAMLARWRDQDCVAARRQSAPETMQLREQLEWRWLPPERAAAERQAVAQATARLSADCPAPVTDKAELQRRGEQTQAMLAAAQAAGDLYARLELSSGGRNPPPDLAAQARALMYDAVLSGDPEAIARLWRVEFLERRGRHLNIVEQSVDFNLWPLVACDLGMDCGPGSRALDRACLDPGAGCGYPSLEALVRDRSAPWQYALTLQRRRQIVERIRSGQIAGMFDPPPPPVAPPNGG